MTKKVWNKIVGSEKYSYKTFVKFIDNEIDKEYVMLKLGNKKQRGVRDLNCNQELAIITSYPIIAPSPIIVDEKPLSAFSKMKAFIGDLVKKISKKKLSLKNILIKQKYS